MREYIFRGKRIDNGEWVEGGSIFKLINKTGEHFFIPQCGEKVIATHDDNMNIIALEGCILYKVDPETVGQYTEMRDCKRTEEYPEGQMIFDGDIVEGCDFTPEDGGYGVVSFENGAFVVSGNNSTGTFYDNFWGYEFEVIGNIHDNPELLKGDEIDGNG